MWLKEVHIHNFRSLKDIQIEFTEGINVLFGENGTGKTNIVNSILKLLGPSYPGQKSFQKEDHFHHNEEEKIQIHLVFRRDRNSKRTTTIKWDIDSRGRYRLIRDRDEYIQDSERLDYCPLHMPPNRAISDIPDLQHGPRLVAFYLNYLK